MHPSRSSSPCPFAFSARNTVRCLTVACLILSSVCPPLHSADLNAGKQKFNLPAGPAENTLNLFSEQSGQSIVVGTMVVRGVHTKPVRGEFVAREALDSMLVGTGLVAARDEKSGGFTIRRDGNDPNVPRAAQATESDRPKPDRNIFPSKARPSETGEANDNAIVSLSPFEVSTSADVGYESLSANSITGLNVPLGNLPVTAEIYNKQFYDDLGISSLGETLLEWASGQSPNGKPTTALTLQGDYVGNTPFVIRGIPAGGSPRVDGFLAGELTFLDNTSQDRTEIIRGPQSLLYGSSAAGGVVNVVTKQANLSRNSVHVRARVDGYGTLRGEFDANVVLRPDLALRMVLTRANEWYYSEDSGKKVSAWFMAGVYRPFQRATIRINGGVSTVDKIRGQDSTLNLANDPRSGIDLNLLLARGQTKDLYFKPVDWTNTDSLAGVGQVFHFNLPSLGVTTDLGLTRWLNLRIMGGYQHYNDDDGIRNAAPQGLLPPSFSANPTGKWATGGRPDISRYSVDAKGIRSLLNAKFNLWRGRIRNDLTVGAETKQSRTAGMNDGFYLVDSNGAFVIDPARLGNGLNGRIGMPVIYWSLEDGPGNPFRRGKSEYTVNGSSYRRAQVQIPGSVPATPVNPRGFNGAAPPTDDQITTEGYFASIYSEWFNNRFSTLGGFRRDYQRLERADASSQAVWTNTWSAGAVFHFNEQLGIYYNHSLSFAPNGTAGASTQSGQAPSVNNGIGDEAGIKFSIPRWKVSGSLAFYNVAVKDNFTVLRNGNDIVDPPSVINGRHFTKALSYFTDSTVRGLELSMTASPTRNWRTRLSFSYNSDEVGNRVTMQRWYNDDFSVNASGQVLFNNGAIATVPSIAGNLSSPQVPLTIAMMKTPGSGYTATLDTGSGQIRNLGGRTFASLGLLGRADGLTIGTNRTGLPITAHQLNWVPPTEDFVIIAGGDRLTIPRNSVSTSVTRSFSDGRLKGFSAGLTIIARQHQLAYYYVDAAAGGARREKVLPDQLNTNLMLSYNFKLLSKHQWTTQINITNLLNHRDLVYILNTGSGVPISAKMNGVPRSWSWSNTVAF